LVSERRTPAMKAPKVFDNPNPSVRADMANTVSRITARNASWLSDLATKLKNLQGERYGGSG